MVFPLEWVKEIRDEPDTPVAKEVEVAQSEVRSDLAFADQVMFASTKYEMDWKLVAAVMKAESNLDPFAVSPKGAQGLMQLMPDTARLYRVQDPYDPRENIEAGVKHLKKLLNRFDNKLDLALAAYNSGEKTVDRYRGIPPYPETRQYVKRVLNLYRNL